MQRSVQPKRDNMDCQMPSACKKELPGQDQRQVHQQGNPYS